MITVFSFSAYANSHFAVFMVVRGDVKVISKKGVEEKAKSGLLAYEGDKIIVGADSSTKLVTLDRNVLVIGEKSELVVEKYDHKNPKNKVVMLKMLEGSIRNALQQKYDQKNESFRVTTPTAVAGVRGTDFLVEYRAAADENVICTFSGSVAYLPKESKAEYLVDAGKFIRHKTGTDVKVGEPKPAWLEKTLKSHEVTGSEEFPADVIQRQK